MNPFLALMIGHIPLEVVSIGGLVALGHYWKSMKRSAAQMVLAALVINQLLFVLNVFFAYWTHTHMAFGSPSTAELSRLRFYLSLPQILAHATAWGLLLGAAFAAHRPSGK